MCKKEGDRTGYTFILVCKYIKKHKETGRIKKLVTMGSVYGGNWVECRKVKWQSSNYNFYISLLSKCTCITYSKRNTHNSNKNQGIKLLEIKLVKYIIILKKKL